MLWLHLLNPLHTEICLHPLSRNNGGGGGGGGGSCDLTKTNKNIIRISKGFHCTLEILHVIIEV